MLHALAAPVTPCMPVQPSPRAHGCGGSLLWVSGVLHCIPKKGNMTHLPPPGFAQSWIHSCTFNIWCIPIMSSTTTVQAHLHVGAGTADKCPTISLCACACACACLRACAHTCMCVRVRICVRVYVCLPLAPASLKCDNVTLAPLLTCYCNHHHECAQLHIAFGSSLLLSATTRRIAHREGAPSFP